MRRPAALGAGFALALVLSGCGGGPPAAKVEESPSTSASPSPTKAVPKPKTPKALSCYDLSYKEATKATTDVKPRSCDKDHTSQTIYVGNFNSIVDGHFLAIDSKAVQRQIREACPPRLADWVGGDTNAQRLSRFKMIWFSPTLEEADAGADWFRCDLVAVADKKKLATLPANTQGILNDPAVLDTMGTCNTGDPSESKSRRVICSEPHTWRAQTTTEFPKTAKFGDKDLRATGNSSCRDLAKSRAANPLDFKWSYEIPDRTEWDAGVRYGICWIPTES